METDRDRIGEREFNLALAEQTQKFKENPPIDQYGTPTSKLAYDIIQYFYKSRQKDINLEHLAKSRGMSEEQLAIMLGQLKDMELIIETSPENFRYNMNPDNADLQAKVETCFVYFTKNEHRVGGPFSTPFSKYDCLPDSPGGERPTIR